MKNIIVIITALSLLSSCKFRSYECERKPLQGKGFDIPNLITVLNPQDSFNINDTLWLRIEFPASFYGKNKSCDYNDNSITVAFNQFDTYYSNRQSESVLGFFDVVPEIGSYSGKPSGLYSFALNNNRYIAKFGVLLSDTALTAIGINDSIAQIEGYSYGIRLASRNDTGCTYDDDECAVGKKRNPYGGGFYINTSFQGGITEWKINMRR